MAANAIISGHLFFAKKSFNFISALL